MARLRYYISSRDFDAKQFNQAVREHWSTENGQHWTLDVVFHVRRHQPPRSHCLRRTMAESLASSAYWNWMSPSRQVPSQIIRDENASWSVSE